MPLNDLYQMLDPVAFSIGSLQIRWYGLAYIAAFLLGGFVFYRIEKRWKLNISAEDIATLVIVLGFGAVIGGRAGEVLFYNAPYYWAHPEEIIMFSHGGMSFHGGLIGVLVAGALACKANKLSFLTMCDIGVIVAPIGLGLGRLANFVNGELWGKPTELPIGVIFGGSAGVIPRHPSQLYEAFFEGLVLFVIPYLLSRKVPPRPQGTFLGLFLILYALFRIAVEFVRVPDPQLGYLVGPVTMGMLLSVPMAVAGIAILIWAHKIHRPQVGYIDAHSSQAETPQAKKPASEETHANK